jgi:hypothetical protein
MAREECGQEEWSKFSLGAEDKISCLRTMVRELRAAGKRVAGYGASAKSTVWINACGFRRTEIEAVFDCTPEKLYRNIPGTDIPVMHEGAFFVDGPDYAICFAWNFMDEIVAKNQKWLKAGGKFICPHPLIQIIGAQGVVPFELELAEPSGTSRA